MAQPVWRMGLKFQVLALAVLPLLLAMGVVAAWVAHQAEVLTEQQAQLIEEQLLAAKRTELQNYAAVAFGALSPLLSAEGDELANQARAKAVLGSTRYGEDGYFFVYDQHGTCLVHPTMPELVGRDLRGIRDSRGRPLIPNLIDTARQGGGFQRYAWSKPSAREVVEKMSFVRLLPRWGWVIGTGVYMDDIARVERALRERSASSVSRTLGTLGLVSALAVGLVFIGGLALNTRQRRLADTKLKRMAQRIVGLQEEERARVSRNLHDGISQMLVATKLQLESAEHALGTASPPQLQTGLRQLSEAIVAVRDVSHEMRPLELDQLGLSGALRQLAKEFAERSGLRATFSGAEAPDLSEDAAVALFRIAQEGLTNVERHARAREVRLTLSLHSDAIQFDVEDDGHGFDVVRVMRDPACGIGLRNMRERVEHLGGHFRVESAPGRTALHVQLPTSS